MKWFDRVYLICMADRPEKRQKLLTTIQSLYPEANPTVFEAINTRDMPKLPNQSGGHHVGCALSHRTVIQDAKARGHDRVLVLEEDARLHRELKWRLSMCTYEIDKYNIPWDLLYLGACTWKNTFSNITPSLQTIWGCTCTHGIAYNKSFFDEILDTIPDNKQGVLEFLRQERAIDQWLLKYQREGRAVMCSPRLVSQPFLIGQDRQDNEDDYID